MLSSFKNLDRLTVNEQALANPVRLISTLGYEQKPGAYLA